MARGVIVLGDWTFPGPPGNGVAIVRPTSSVKVDKREADGQDDATTTTKGRKTGEIEVEFRWADEDGDPTGADAYAVRMLYDISPRGPKSGKPFEWVADDQEIHAAYSVIVETLKGPIRVPGAEATATATMSTWVKRKPAQLVTKTPDAAQPWGTKPGVAVFTRRKLPGFANNPVTVKP